MGNPASPIFIIGSDTGVGKTVFTALLLHHLRSSGVDARAIKPIATGDQSDAALLRELQDEGPLSEVNRWFWPEPITPLLAARNAGERLNLEEVVLWIQEQQTKCKVLLVETAGGLFSPLGADFSSFELLQAFTPQVVTVITNRVGAINQARLVNRALTTRKLSQVIVLMGQKDSTCEIEQSNCKLISEFTNQVTVPIPFLGAKASQPATIRAAISDLERPLQKIVAALTER